MSHVRARFAIEISAWAAFVELTDSVLLCCADADVLLFWPCLLVYLYKICVPYGKFKVGFAFFLTSHVHVLHHGFCLLDHARAQNSKGPDSLWRFL